MAKLRETKMEAAKRIGAVALAGALVLGGTTACTNLNSNNTTTPNIGGISNSTKPSTPSSSNKENEKHSALLMSVVNDEYYKALVARTTLETNNNPALDPHPYAFLEDQGINVDKILDGTYKAETMTFVFDDEPNNLYINTRVLIDDSYYQSYLLTYQLNDKEMADYRLVHGTNKTYSYSWPAFFINDKISETKQPIKVLTTKYTKKTHDVFQKKVDSYVSAKKDFILPSIDASGHYLYLEYPSYSNSTIPTQTKTISILKFKYNNIKKFDSIFEIGENFDRAELLEKEKKQATAFQLQNSSLTRGKDFNSLSND